MARQRNGKNGSLKRHPLERLRVFGDPVLKQSARQVDQFDDRLRAVSDIMFEIMEQEGGVGLAAPQIGLSSRIVVWKDPEDDKQSHTFVNPRVVACSEQSCTEEEGCLSVPGVVMPVTRPEEVTVVAQDLQGDSFEVTLSGFPARVVQHEIDHLDGLLILDRTSPEERRRALKELRERSLERSQ
jgi:peptide deformylase